MVGLRVIRAALLPLRFLKKYKMGARENSLFSVLVAGTITDDQDTYFRLKRDVLICRACTSMG